MDYNLIYEKFLELSGYDYSDLPQEDSKVYKLINDAVSLYNSKAKKYPDILKGGVICDDNTESINININGTDLLVLIYFMCKITATKKYMEFTSLWGTVANETGIKEYNAQSKAKQIAIKFWEDQIETLISDEITTFD